jgi:hypothetical protein
MLFIIMVCLTVGLATIVKLIINIGVRRGVSKGVEDGCRLPTLLVG